MRPLLILLLLTSYCGSAQTVSISPRPKIYYSVNDFVVQTIDSSISNCLYDILSGKIIIKYTRGQTKHVAIDSVWGYQSRNENPVRIYHGGFYRVVGTGLIALYSKRVVKSRAYYFSKSLDGEIYDFTKKDLKSILGSEQYAKVMSDKMIRQKLYF